MERFPKHTDLMAFSSSDKVVIECLCGFDLARFGGRHIDQIVFALDAEGKVKGDDDVVFFGQMFNPSGSIQELDAWPESVIAFDFANIPDYVESIVIAMSIYEEKPPLDFGDITSIAVKIRQFIPPDLAGDVLHEMEYSVDFGSSFQYLVWELVRGDGSWTLRATGDLFAGSLVDLVSSYGIDI